MVAPLLEVRRLDVSVRDKKGREFKIVDGISFDVQPGEVIALIGESGSGKTTISLACMGYTRPGCHLTGGTVTLGGTNVLDLDLPALQDLRGRDITYVAQSAAASFNGAMTIDAQVTEIPVITGAMTREKALAKAARLYRDLELPDPENIGKRYPHQVSGGQLQRLMAAMAMISDPRLLILDEPTTALDVTTQIEVLYSFKKLIADNGTAAIYVTHDLSLVAQVADHILVLKDGKMVEYGPTEQIIRDPQHDYTKALMAAAHLMPEEIHAPPAIDAEEPPLLQVRNVTAGYGPAQKLIALRNIDLTINAGETVGVIGESGSGKTTLGRLISGLMGAKEGGVYLDGKQLAPSVGKRRREELRQIQFAFQMADVALNPRQRLNKILSRPMMFYRGLSQSEANREVARLLERVDLPTSFAWRFPPELSGGQRQRVNLARALAAEPRLIICDEITSALDTIVAQQILDLLENLQEDLGVSYMFITHDIATVSKISDRIAVMRHGRIVAQGPVNEVLTPPCHEYTQILINSVPEMRTDWLDEAVVERRRLVAALD
ncbi:ABC transporter ATP-binding protein [Defluviimonas sp. D31]|uniref:ABC transporter ATP-binding protein n=1 Tax=Defluviimonas sp. D31 TaxID=3083253 RepID=UPI00296F3433|nr:ABC transporter ATP-binding protein [Defluviimonas sp. D31]MDW4551222.1 ABC transporter ATP-binding protein [Defluviimonas sp. D31]